MVAMLRPVLKLTNKELVMRHGLRRLDPIDFKEQFVCRNPGPPPQLVLVAPWQLVVNEEYQRSLTNGSKHHIRNIAQNFNWDLYTPISIVKCDDLVCSEAGETLYEVIDGQHESIAAAVNAQIPQLPAMLWNTRPNKEVSLEEKAEAFIGINTGRKALSPMNIFNAELTAGKPEAIAIQCALSFSGCQLLEFPPPRGNWKVGDLQSIGSLKQIVRREKNTSTHLTRVLKVAKEAECAPISMVIIKALDIVLRQVPEPSLVDDSLAAIIRGQGAGRLELIAKANTSRGKQTFQTLAAMLREKAGLDASATKKTGRSVGS